MNDSLQHARISAVNNTTNGPSFQKDYIIYEAGCVMCMCCVCGVPQGPTATCTGVVLYIYIPSWLADISVPTAKYNALVYRF